MLSESATVLYSFKQYNGIVKKMITREPKKEVLEWPKRIFSRLRCPMFSQHQVADNEYKRQAVLDNNNGNENNCDKSYHKDIISHEV